MDDKIAIVGLGCRFPGATNLREFWNVLVNGENHVVDVPPDRWNMEAFFDPNPDAIGKSYSRKAGFIKNFDHFDNKLFRINESEAAGMDPQQRQVLETTYMALENAGITRQEIAGKKVGVYLGAMDNDYGGMVSLTSPDISNNTVTGQAGSIVANRVSYVFDLRGPSMVIDTACSSSIVCMHQAILGIKSGDCSMAITGAVNILMNPGAFVKLSKARMMSPTGQCHAFSDKADGYTRGEGCGIVILKPLKQAEIDGDRIWGTVVTGINQDGRQATPITAPSEKQQGTLLEEVYTKFNVDPSNIEYIEAHGTAGGLGMIIVSPHGRSPNELVSLTSCLSSMSPGKISFCETPAQMKIKLGLHIPTHEGIKGTGTRLGDPIEVGALGSMFETYPRQRYIGSVKTNIGHLESAAGVAGLIKVLLMMKHNTIVPSLHFDKPNELIDFDRYGFVVPTSTIPWETECKISCINSFGFGGSNSHVVITSHPGKATKSTEHGILPVCFSGSTEESLYRSIEEFSSLAEGMDLLRAAYTSCVRREHFVHRKVILASSLSELKSLLPKTQEKPKSPSGKKQLKINFMFCGMGTAWNGMCVALMDTFPWFKLEMEIIDQSLSRFVDWSLVDRFMSGYDVSDPVFGPISIVACQIAIARMLMLFNVMPSGVIGQSVGEVSAAHIAGILPLDEAVKVIYHRATILAKATGGKMLFVRNIGETKAKALCEKYDLDVALVYSPVSRTFSGNAKSIHKVKEELETQHDVVMQELPVTSAFHSRHMEQCQTELDAVLTDLSTQTEGLTIQMVSTVDSSLDENLIGKPLYWGRNVREQVKLSSAVKKAAEEKSENIFIEIGPKPVLGAHLDDIFEGSSISKRALATMKRNSGSEQILRCIADLFEHGMDVSWKSIFPEPMLPVDIPLHQFCHKQLLVVSHDKRDFLNGVVSRDGHLFLKNGDSDKQKKVMIDPFTFPSVFEHNVRGTILLPGAVFAEAAMAFLSSDGTPGNMVLDIYFKHTVTLMPGQITQLSIQENTTEIESKNFRKLTVTRNDDTVCANITVKNTPFDLSEDRIDVQSIRERCPKFMTGDDIYHFLSHAGFRYKDRMSVIMSSQTGELESLSTLRVGELLKKETQGTIIHPAIIDGMLQVPPTIANKYQDVLPFKLENFTLRRKPEDDMLVYAKQNYTSDTETSYAVTLTTLEGLKICEIERFVLRVIGADDFDPCAASYVITAEPLVEPFRRATYPTKDSMIVFTEKDIPGLPWRTIPLSKKKGISEKDLVGVIENYSIVSVLFCMKPANTTKGELLQMELEMKIMPLIELLMVMSENALKIPLLVVTVTPCLDNKEQNEALFCLHESISSFLKCVRREYPMMILHHFDIGIDSNEGDAVLVEKLKDLYSLDLTSQQKTTEVKQLNGTYYQPKYKVYPNQAPSLRLISVDQSKNIAIYSESHDVADESVFAVCIPKEDMSNGTKYVPVTVYSAVAHSKCLTDRLLIHHVGNGFNVRYPVLSYEFWGVSDRKSKSKTETIVACYPSEVKLNMLIPKCCLIKHKYVKSLQPGDVLKLYVLWCLCKEAELKNVGILYSTKTQSYAKTLQIIMDSLKRPASLISVEGMRELPSVQSVICTVQLTKRISYDILQNLPSAKHVVTFEPTTKSSNIQNLLMKEINFTLIKPVEILSPVKMKSCVPRFFKWITSNQKRLVPVQQLLCKCRSFDPLNSQAPFDISELLHTRELKMSEYHQQGLVNTLSNNLFLKSASYMVVGGQTGLGLECVSYLARSGAGCVVILSRRKPSVEIQKEMETLEQTHRCVIRFIQADVTIYDHLQPALSKLRNFQPYFPLKGIFFGAAVLKDGLIAQMTNDWFRVASAPKVIGAWNLHILTKDVPLDYFVMFSSVTSAFGNAGQANYGAGNGFLDGLAHVRRQKGLPGQSINWGPLGLGMLDSRSDLKKKMKSHGYLVIEKVDLQKCIDHAILLNERQMILCHLDPVALGQNLIKENNQDMLSRFEPVLSKYSAKLKVNTEEEGGIDIESLRGKPPSKILECLTNYVKTLVCDIAMVDSIDIDLGAREQGVDSMNFMQIAGKILSDTNVQISAATLTVQNPSVKELAEILYKDKFKGDTNSDYNSAREIDSPPKEVTYYSRQDLLPGEISAFENYLRNPDQIAHLMITKNDLPSRVTADMIKGILKESVSRHPISHTTFHLEDGTMYKVMRDPDDTFDFRISQENDVEKTLQERFFLDRMSPIRFIFVPSDPPKLIIAFHKIAYDKEGIRIIMDEFLALCYAYSQGKSMDTVYKYPDLDIVTEYRNVLQPIYESTKQFWAETLSRIPHVSFADRTSPQKRATTFKMERELVKKDFENLTSFSERHSLSIFHCLVGLYELLLSFRANEQFLALTTVINLRLYTPKLLSSVGRCANMIPLVCRVPENSSSVLDFLIKNRKLLEECKENGIFPFQDLKKSLPPHSIVNLMTNFVIFGDDEIKNEGKTNSFHGNFNSEALQIRQFSLHTELYFDVINRKNSDTIIISLDGREDCFTTKQINKIITAYFSMLSDTFSNPTMTLGELKKKDYVKALK